MHGVEEEDQGHFLGFLKSVQQLVKKEGMEIICCMVTQNNDFVLLHGNVKNDGLALRKVDNVELDLNI